MRICRNNVCIQIGLNEFLDVLESDLVDDLLMAVVELDEYGLGQGTYEANLEEWEYDEEEDIDEVSTVYFMGEDSEERSLEELFGSISKNDYYTETDKQIMRMLSYFGNNEEDEENVDDYI